MAYEHPSQDALKQLLSASKTIAVVGLSEDPTRTSHMVAAAMQNKGYRIIPVNPKAAQILGETCYATLEAVPEAIDIVNVFRRSEFCLDVTKEAAAVKAGAVWLQQGIVNEEAAAYAKEHGMDFVMDACIKVVDAILLPEGKPHK
ncbi:CoA-binding protein [Paenibacillus sp. ACRRX]|uniref:CoA-binding protein n=1 Tax=unclassified Paenibacillus TaxID=185978 RepID=UPI001EF4816A|nr:MULTISPECIES: CoA-binding protein [unclassified Paenibacillus]MCG7407644.1 CoA-binding protein [Paenibacillus sp. ACRRX]MDK8180879.1 CoA-binding protein [Paenibacillus sp. UMB4589-SE434]